MEKKIWISIRNALPTCPHPNIILSVELKTAAAGYSASYFRLGVRLFSRLQSLAPQSSPGGGAQAALARRAVWCSY